jgi:hypothetical protein
MKKSSKSAIADPFKIFDIMMLEGVPEANFYVMVR